MLNELHHAVGHDPGEGLRADVWLQDQGFQVLRLPNELVIASTELAVARVRAPPGG